MPKSTFVLTLKLNTEKYQEDILNKRLDIGRQIYNACLNELFKRYNSMKQSKIYQKTLKMEKSKERNKHFREINNNFGLTEYSLHKFVKPMQHHFKKNIDSFTAQKIATRCFSAFEENLYNPKIKVKFKRYEMFNSLEGKSNKTGIRYLNQILKWNKLDIPILIKKKDDYVKEALENKIKYCRILRKTIRGKNKYYIQLILEGIPPKKERTTKNQKVGLDIGTSTIAIVSNETIKLLELAPKIDKLENKKRILLRKLDRQRRLNNPDNFNKNGTLKKGIKIKWNNSNNYIKSKNKLKEIMRKQKVLRKQSHEKLANYIISLGNEIYVENMNFKGLQKRAKATTINKKTGKFNKKKRFGKSLSNKAPAKLIEIINRKLNYLGKEILKVNTWKVKASQYNHNDDSFKKKKLNERWNVIDGQKIQRDLYSAFLIMNVKNNLEEIDRELCIKNYQKFKKNHDKEINKIKTSKIKTLASMGI
ncbi:transposase [Clostridiaceae bacterium HSG29]|nr:transposase [Clostridiaceae bacterium HSG29]